MTHNPFAAVQIITRRFHLRSLRPADVSERYLSWFSAPAAAHITASPRTLDELRAFVTEKAGKSDVLFLGIFDEQGRHIGNIKYEPVDTATGEAVMGIFVGEPEWQGRGVGPEVIAASGAWLRDRHRISVIVLGVAHDNTRAVRAYEKIGFVSQPSHRIPAHPTIRPMALATARLPPT